MKQTMKKLKKSKFKAIAIALLLTCLMVNVFVYAEECIGEQCSANMTINITDGEEEPPLEEPAYLSSPIYQTLQSAGTGFAIFMSDAGSGLGVFVVGIILVVIVGMIVFALVKFFSSINFSDYFKITPEP